MENPTGRHRRPRQSLAGRVWALTAAVLAVALAYVFVPQRPRRERVALTPPPRRRELPPTPLTSERRAHAQRGSQLTRALAPHTDGIRVPLPRPRDDEAPGALVRPYMPPLPSVLGGDLLADPIQPVQLAQTAHEPTDDLADLAAVIRVYLDTVG
ncbi:hypothetical protein [Nocardiopsis sp. CNS-639]|uniref:hypothetical protein n=1 Tax=Nocardiopsis sp. CNS-639 TaxID=1169153 RepID=UPI00039AD9FA|nr:hypothetical protein [Nocardiopsis sp. CNS-639]